MSEFMTQYVAEALTRDNQRAANQPSRLMAHELRTTRRAQRRRRKAE
ncbi:MAG: hypothetical protein ACRDO4_12045 [Nocardioides sp.]